MEEVNRNGHYMPIVIGVDPDSKKHGIAIYDDGVLIDLLCDDLFGFMDILNGYKDRDVEVHIEDVNGVSAAFTGRDKTDANLHVKMKMAQHIGMCKQSQLELQRVCGHMVVSVVKHRVSKKWKKEKAQFEKITGWKGRSNEDSRSAAWFGYIGIKKI